MLETDSGTGLVGTANPGKAPVHTRVDNNPLALEGARTFQQDSTTAWAEWRSKYVKGAQVLLIATSSLQIYLGLTYAVIGILPLVSSILGLVLSILYFSGDISSLNTTLNRVRLPAVLMIVCCNRTRIDASFLFGTSNVAHVGRMFDWFLPGILRVPGIWHSMPSCIPLHTW
jgi:hypothetical protein